MLAREPGGPVRRAPRPTGATVGAPDGQGLPREQRAEPDEQQRERAAEPHRLLRRRGAWRWRCRLRRRRCRRGLLVADLPQVAVDHAAEQELAARCERRLARGDHLVRAAVGRAAPHTADRVLAPIGPVHSGGSRSGLKSVLRRRLRAYSIPRTPHLATAVDRLGPRNGGRLSCPSCRSVREAGQQRSRPSVRSPMMSPRA